MNTSHPMVSFRRLWQLGALSLSLLTFGVGCSLFGGESLSRVDADSVLEVLGADRAGEWSATLVTLAEPADIRKIVIVPGETLRKLEIQIQQNDGEWKSVQNLDGRYAHPITVHAEMTGKAVRVIEKTPASHRQSGPHVAGTPTSIETILIYGHPLTP